MTQGDTTAALSELETASQVAGDEPWVRYSYGYALAAAGKGDAALEQLDAAIALEPLYALPFSTAGKIWEQRGEVAKAIAAYEAFLARASSGDPQRAHALASAGQVDAAFEQLSKATELEPLYARPYPIIAKIWERRGDATKAMAAYEAFLARASNDDPQRALVDQAIENLQPFLNKGS